VRRALETDDVSVSYARRIPYLGAARNPLGIVNRETLYTIRYHFGIRTFR
jgi:hypothetical protein